MVVLLKHLKVQSSKAWDGDNVASDCIFKDNIKNI